MSPDARALPRVIAEARNGAQRLYALNAAAEASGLHAGLSLADARARFPALAVAAADPQADARLLASLADACERYTPLLALDGPEGLLLDVTGCAHLFGGEEGMVRDLLDRLRRHGFHARAALAGTAGAAFALARFPASAARRGVVVPAEEDIAPLLAALPLAALRLDARHIEALGRLGLRRVGDLLGKPRAPLAARFGTELPDRIEAVLGLAPVALDYRFPPPVFCAERNLFDPVEQTEAVLDLTLRLAASLAQALERHGVGARRLDLALFRVDGQVTRLAVGSGRPLREPAAVRRLFAEKIATLSCLEPGFGFDLVRLAAREVAPLVEQQPGFAAQEDGAGALDGLIDRLSIRFGVRQVGVAVTLDSHWPEAAAGSRPAQAVGAAALVTAARAQAGAAGTHEGMAAEATLCAGFPMPCVSACGAGGPATMDERQAPAGGVSVISFPARLSPPAFASRHASPPQQSVPAEPGGWTGSPDGATADTPDLCGPDRPLRLFEVPEPVEAVAEVPDGAPSHFQWRRRRHEVVRAEGPERIAAEWWRQGPAVQPAPTRDYFRVETTEGQRFWLFRSGLYGREEDTPRWFLHGLFG